MELIEWKVIPAHKPRDKIAHPPTSTGVFGGFLAPNKPEICICHHETQKNNLKDQTLNLCHDCHPLTLKTIVPNAPLEEADAEL